MGISASNLVQDKAPCPIGSGSRSSIDSEPALVLGPLKSAQELRREQQLAEIETRRQEREKNGKEEGEEGRARPPGQEMVDELQGPFSYDFSYWAR